jgi:glycerol-3-phosphate O-acyltransferase
VSERPLITYEPNPLLAWVYNRFFEHIEVDQAWADAVREADKRGTVVYVLRNLSFVDFFALDYLTKRYHLPQIRFANDLGLSVLEPMGRGWLNALRPRNEASDAEDLRRAVTTGASAALFLKRPAHLLEPKARGKIEGDLFVRTLFEAQRASDKPILLVPQVFVWSKQPDAAQQNAVDTLFGPREWPGNLRTLAQFLANYRHVTLRSGEPVDVRAFLENETASNGGGKPVDDSILVRRITYTLLRRLERERKAVLGPVQKPADRLRAEVVRSPKLKKVIQDMAGEGAAEQQVITWRALGMLREMEAALDLNAVSTLDSLFQQISSRMFSAIEVDEEGLERLRTLAKDGTLVLLPSHKSHLDYMVISHLFYRHHMPLPLIASGDNLNFFPMGPVLRRAGAFFIRRSFHGDRLYAAVVDAYIRRLLKDGWPLEFFLEGGRSRSGKLLAPKVGLLSMVVDAALGVTGRKIYFCPISIGYERFVEEKAFVHELSGGEKKAEDMRGLVSSVGAMIGRYGRLSVQFGEPLTLEAVLREFDASAGAADLTKLTPARRRAVVTRLAYRVMNEINRVTAVTPGALVATALLTHDKRGLPHEELVETCERLAKTLYAFGARFSPSLAHPTHAGKIRQTAIRDALDLFARAGHVEAYLPGAPVGTKDRVAPAEDAVYVVPPQARLSLDLSKNLVTHFMVGRAMIATALLAPPQTAPSSGPPPSEPRAGVPTQAVRERVQALSRLFKFEFQFRADAPFDQIFEEEVDAMIRDGEIVRSGETLAPAGEEGAKQIALYANVVRSFLEGYRVAARGLTALVRGPLAVKDLTRRAIASGERMFLAGEIERREAVSRPVIENAYAAFVDQGYVNRTDGKFVLPDSYGSASAVRTIEMRIAGYLPERRAEL